MARVYRLIHASEWSWGAYLGTPHDVASGFIHMSTAAQAAGTAAKHFKEAPGAKVLVVDADFLHRGGLLRWEASESRGGVLFPHCYGGCIPKDAILGAESLYLLTTLRPGGLQAALQDLYE